MARSLITFILCLSFIQGFSQEHLMFLGLPIDGTVNEYAAKLKLKGFSVSPKNEYASKGLRVMQGPFLGKTEEFGLHYDTDTKKMYSVTFVREFYSEEEAKELYDKLVSLLHEKHDDAKYKSPLSGSHIYSCSFQSDKGIISLAVQLHDYEYRVKMTYCDRINYMPVYKKQRQKALDDM